MRFHGVVLAAAMVALSACSGGESAADTTATAAGTVQASTPAATSTAAPVTGTIHEVKMIGDDKGYRFEPVDITIKQGDGIKWVMVSGGPHNVQFENVAADAKAQLLANMPNQLVELSSPMLITPNENYQMSFANVKPGKYDYVCTPHLANNMRGSVTVQ